MVNICTGQQQIRIILWPISFLRSYPRELGGVSCSSACIILLIQTNDMLVFVFEGKYMYTEATVQSAGDNAKLQVVLPRSNSSSCLTFYYHMYGSSMGTLNVFSGNTAIFTASGNNGDYWRKVAKTLNSNYVVSMVISKMFRHKHECMYAVGPI